MNRREFLTLSSAFAGVAGCGRGLDIRPNVAFDGGRKLNITGVGLEQSVRFAVIGDTHFAFHDKRDEEYADFYKRMAQWPTAKAPFEKMLAKIGESGIKTLLLLGDNISFPTLANIEYLKTALDASALDWHFIAGNHDWHFEGDGGSDLEQRSRWIEKRLLPLYRGRNPLMYSLMVGGLRVVMIDNSAYHILPEQLEFWRAEAAKGDPMMLAMHIPFWQPGYSIFTCASPDWGAANDPYWQIERRERWALQLTPATAEFREAVYSTPNLTAILAGHEHRLMFASADGKVQVVTPSNRNGEYLEIKVS